MLLDLFLTNQLDGQHVWTALLVITTQLLDRVNVFLAIEGDMHTTRVRLSVLTAILVDMLINTVVSIARIASRATSRMDSGKVPARAVNWVDL